VTFNFSRNLPILGYGVRALQNLYLPEDKDKAKQQSSMVQMIKDRCAVPSGQPGSWGLTGPPGHWQGGADHNTPMMLCTLLARTLLGYQIVSAALHFACSNVSSKKLHKGVAADGTEPSSLHQV